VLGAAFGAATIGLVGLPFVGVFLGHSLVDDAAVEQGHSWLPPLLMLAAGVSSGAIMRAGARIFLGWGERDDPLLSEEPPEEPPEHEANVPVMVTVTCVVVALGVVASVVPGLEDRAGSAADRFRGSSDYIERTLHGKVSLHGPPGPLVLHHATSLSLAYGLGAGVIALAGALFGLYRQRLPRTIRSAFGRILTPPVAALKELHSGVVADYVMWITVGTAVLGGVWALTLRGP
jgi:multicomponent Na+:H+ antiporter subunit D